MPLTNEELAELMDQLALNIDGIREDQDSEMKEVLPVLEKYYSAIREVRQWRKAFPGHAMVLYFETPYGVQGLQ